MMPTAVDTAKLFQNIPPGLVLDLAIGNTGAEEIFLRYGYSTEQAEFLMNWEPLKQQVLAKRTEMDRDGLTHQFRAKYLADETLTILGAKILAGELTPMQTLEVYKELKKSGNMDVAVEQQMNKLPSFQIVIEIPGRKTVSLSSPHAQNAVEQAIEGVSVEVPDVPPLPMADMGSVEHLLALDSDD